MRPDIVQAQDADGRSVEFVRAPGSRNWYRAPDGTLVDYFALLDPPVLASLVAAHGHARADNDTPDVPPELQHLNILGRNRSDIVESDGWSPDFNASLSRTTSRFLRVGRFRIYFDRRDWWIGYYRGPDHHYVCPLPTLVIRWRR